jgi:hypothetical protein
MKMEQTVCSEMPAFKIQMPGNYPEENIQHATGWNVWVSNPDRGQIFRTHPDWPWPTQPPILGLFPRGTAAGVWR